MTTSRLQRVLLTYAFVHANTCACAAHQTKPVVPTLLALVIALTNASIDCGIDPVLNRTLRRIVLWDLASACLVQYVCHFIVESTLNVQLVPQLRCLLIQLLHALLQMHRRRLVCCCLLVERTLHALRPRVTTRTLDEEALVCDAIAAGQSADSKWRLWQVEHE